MIEIQGYTSYEKVHVLQEKIVEAMINIIRVKHHIGKDSWVSPDGFLMAYADGYDQVKRKATEEDRKTLILLSQLGAYK